MNRMFTHELVTAVRAPAAVLSDRDGQLRQRGAQGFLVADVRHLSELTVLVDGEPAAPVGHWTESAAASRFVGAVIGLGDDIGDPTVRLERGRRVEADTLTEAIALVNDARTEVAATVSVRLAADLAPILAFRHGRPTTPVTPHQTDGALAGWAAGSCTTTAAADRTPDRVELAADHVRLDWDLRVPARATATVTLRITATSATEDPVVRAPLTRDLGPLTVESREPELDGLVATGLDDLRALLLADPAAPADRFAGAGTPWYFTLFGRDSLWAARFALPLGTDLALGTLRTLARRQGTKDDPETAEQPGKILHEIRQLPAGIERSPGLPPCYYGTIDATPLWISLLHDAWRWGLPAADVEPLLDPMRRALAWLLRHDFLSYVDESGQGLANQGWKDSVDAVQDGAGRIATPPVALSEAQAYAHRAALDAAALLTAFGRPGAGEARAFAAGLADRFRKSFWVNGFPALALDGAGRPVDTLASNLGHLLGTGLLSAAEESTVAARLADLDSGYGLRTMDGDHPFFNPIGYHTGSVWPHDTAIAVDGLVRAGHPAVASALAAGLVRAGTRFGHRLPELYGGWSAGQGPLLDYPGACRPQAWSAAAALVLIGAALGLSADVPTGTLTVAPSPAFAAWFPLRVTGLRVAGHPLAVEVDRDGRASTTTGAPLRVVTGHGR
ncbi:glycogen debranching N-terminal domain-containing protein [Actinophytocola sp.]|uniref:glycogen debranching N-terminal domain-containing protein n=1 Tax=Actinophytocola sp. TaxID=1872138 RepID=UPI003D6BE982